VLVMPLEACSMLPLGKSLHRMPSSLSLRQVTQSSFSLPSWPLSTVTSISSKPV